MSNIIVATFVDDCKTAMTDPLTQWDYGQILQFSGIELPDTYTVYFANPNVQDKAVPQVGDAEGVAVPDTLLTADGAITAWVFLHTGADDGEVMYTITVPVDPRAESDDTPPTPEQQSALDEAIAALGEGVERAEAAADSAEQIAADLGDFETAMEAVTEAKNAAQQSASDASTSACNAAQSAQSAAQSASSAATSAEGAYASEEAAAQSAEDASSSASAAATSATNAAASEAAARAVEESIPADYSALSSDVDNLQTALFDENPLVFEIGGIVAGNPSSSTKYCRTVDFTPCRNGAKLKINNQTSFALSVMSVYYYSEADTSSYISANTIPSVPVGQSAEVALTQTGYFKLRVAQPDAATDMTAADLAAINQSYAVAEFYLADEVAELQEDMAELQEGVADLSEGYTELSDDVSDLESAMSLHAFTDNMAINGAIKELYISGADLSEIDSLSVNKNSTRYQFSFKTGGVEQFTMEFPLTGDFKIYKKGGSIVFGIAVFNSNFDSVMLSANMPCKFNLDKVTVLNENPLIYTHLFGSGSSAFSPSYTKTTGYRINTSGQPTSANSNWFYSSPIQVKAGDTVYFTTAGSSSATPLSLTNSTGSSYTPVVTYSGVDPSDYTYTCNADGYICFSATTGYTYSIYIIRPDESPKVPLFIGAEHSGKVLAVNESGIVVPTTSGGGGGGSNVGIDFLQIAKANNHDIRVPVPVQSAAISADAWVATDATVDGVFDMYDDVNNVTVKAVKITSTANGNAFTNLAAPVNGNNYALMFSILLDPAFNINTSHNGRGVELVLYSGTSRGLSNRWEAYLQYEDSSDSAQTYYHRDGWCHETIAVGSITTLSVGTYFDITDIRAVGVKIKHATGSTRSVYVANMAFVPLMQRPGVLTIIDNFNPSVPDMADYAYSKGVKLNLSIVPGFYAGSSRAPTSAPIEDLERIAEQGFHFIWDHTWEHLVFNDLTSAEIADQVNFAEEWMKNKGYQYSRGADFLSVPSGRFNTTSCNSMFATNAKMIFHTWHGFSAGQVYIPYYPGLRQIQSSKLDTDVTGAAAGTTLATFAEKAITYGGIAVIGFHGTFWERDDGDSWKEYVDAIAEFDCHHYTLEEVYRGMWC